MESDDEVLAGLGRYLEQHQIEIIYTVDDDRLHITRGGVEIFIGYSPDIPTEVIECKHGIIARLSGGRFCAECGEILPGGSDEI